MKFEHIALWAKDLEFLTGFYKRYFGMACSGKYINPKKGYSSYFLSFPGSETRFEIMHRPDISEFAGKKGMAHGLAHISISVGSKERVDELTETFRRDGFPLIGEPRTTGDGYYESVVLDPEGNVVEITV
ncbi:MAG: VOC family protein [Bacteroidota bacterium]